MKIVAVSQRVDIYPDRGERRDALDQRLAGWLVAAGCVPVPVPNTLVTAAGESSKHDESILAEWLAVVQPQAVLLSGGNDIGTAPERDQTEQHLMRYAKDRKLPVLGICRGLQMMAVSAGGALVRADGHVSTRHRLQLAPDAGSFPAEVNSFHNWILSGCPTGYLVAARAEDGSIEAVRHASLPWEGWMWHPEREAVWDAAGTTRLRKLFGSEDVTE